MMAASRAVLRERSATKSTRRLTAASTGQSSVPPTVSTNSGSAGPGITIQTERKSASTASAMGTVQPIVTQAPAFLLRFAEVTVILSLSKEMSS